MKNRSINPYQTDKSKDDWTPLSMWNNLPGHQMLRMFGGVTLGGDGQNILDKAKRLEIDKIAVGDMVYFGNSHGLVTGVILYSDLPGAVLPGGVTLDTGKKLVGTSIVGITVKRYLNYLSPAERVNPTTKGYDVTGDGVTMTYLFYQGLKLAPKYKSGGGALFLYPGSYYVVRKRKDVGSYPDVYNSIQDYQDKYETDTESEALPLEYTMTFNGDSEVVEDGDTFAISGSYDNDVLSTPVLSVSVQDANDDVALANRVTAEIVSNNTTFVCAAVSSGNNTFNFRFTMPIGKEVNVYTGNVVIKITDTVLDVVSTVTAACTFTITE